LADRSETVTRRTPPPRRVGTVRSGQSHLQLLAS
jgi:hypothetical protein